MAISTLKRNPSIVFKPADKGSATVIMSKKNYTAEAERQLSNQKHYTKLDTPVYPQAAVRISTTLDKPRRTGYISKKQREYLEPPDTPRPRLLYLLPKIHKAKDMWPQPQMPLGRPIISDCNSESYNIAEYIDHCLAPLAVTHDSYVKNTTDFIDKVTGIEIPTDALLFSVDVESLYTNIDNNSGIEAVKQAFLRNPDFDRPDVHILELLKISLEHNDFLFASNWYLQIFGTAMEKRFAPSMPTEWEKQALRKCNTLPKIYLRYLDDMFGIWTHGDDVHRIFLDILNSHQNCVKLTSVTSKQSIDFMDTTIFKVKRFNSNGHLDSKIYFKPTDTHQLLYKDSFHPKHTFSGILKSQLLRFHSICNNKSDFEEAVQILFHSLRQRKYTPRF